MMFWCFVFALRGFVGLRVENDVCFLGCNMCKPSAVSWRVHYVPHLWIWIYHFFHVYDLYHVPNTVNKTSSFLKKSKKWQLDKQLRTTRRKFKQSKWRAFVTWLAFQSNGARCICASISPYPPRFHGQPSSELDRCFGRCGCCQSAEGRRFNW